MLSHHLLGKESPNKSSLDSPTNTNLSMVDMTPSSFSKTPEILEWEQDGGKYFAMDNDERAPFTSSDSVSIALSSATSEGLADQTGFLIICCVVLIGDMNRGILFPVMWPLVQELGGNAIWLGYAVASFSVGRIIASPILGKLSIKYGYSRTLISSTSIALLGCLSFAFVYRVGSLYFLVFSQVIIGIGSATLGVTRSYVADITATKERTKYIGLLTAVQYGGFTVTPMFGSFFIWLLQSKRYEMGYFVLDRFSAPSYFMAFLCAITLLFLLSCFHSEYRQKPKGRKKCSRISERDELADRMTCLGVTVYTAALIGCMLLNVSTKGTIGAFETMGIHFAQSHFDLTPMVAGLIVSINGLIGVIALLSMGWLGRVFSDIQMILVGISICTLGIISFAPLVSVQDGGNNSWIHYFVGMFMIYGIGYPIGHTAVIGLFSKVVGRRPQGTLQGYFASAGSLARVLFPIGSGYITNYSNINIVFIVLFVNC